MTDTTLKGTLTFGDLVLVSHRMERSGSTQWYILCPECKEKHRLIPWGLKVWHTSCETSRVEWTITPAEYFVQKPLPMSIMDGATKAVKYE